jgi:MFS family permease
MRTYLNTLRLLNRNGQMLLLSHALVGMAYPGIYVVLFNLYLARLGFGTEEIGLTNGIAIFTYAFLAIPAGIVGKRWGIRRSAIAGVALSATGLGLIPLAGFLPGEWQFAWIVASYTLGWGSAAFYLVNHTPFLMGATEERARNHTFSLLIGLLSVTTGIGNLVGGLLPGAVAAVTGLDATDVAAYGGSLFLAAVVFFLAAPALLCTQEIEYKEQNRTEAVKTQAPYGFIALMGIIILLRVSSEGAGKTFFNVYLDSALLVPTASIGTIMAAGKLLAIPAALCMPLMAARWGRERTVVLSLVGMALFMIPLAQIPHWGAAGLGYMGMFGLAAMANPAMIVYTQEAVPPAWRSTMSGMVSMANGLGMAWIAIGGGYIISAFGFAALHWLGAGLAASGALLFAAYLGLSARRARRAAYVQGIQ